MGLTKYRLGALIHQRREKYNGAESLPVRGVSRDGFMEAKIPDADTSLYNVFYREDFVFNPARMEVNSIAYNREFEKVICSSLYEVFYVSRPDIILPEYLNIYVKRDEFARLCEYIGWGSAREYCRIANISDIEIALPPLPIQQKYVNIYKALQANQRNYERGLEDLKLTIDAQLESLKTQTQCMSLEELVEEVDERNNAGNYSEVFGVNKDKSFMPAIAAGADLSKYKIVQKGHLACNLMHIGRDMAVPIALNRADAPLIVSPAYLVLKPKNPQVSAEYILMWLSREETDRQAWFMTDTNVRSGMERKRFKELLIPIPSSDIHKALVELYEAYISRISINERLKTLLKNICPILIKGAMEEATN